MAPLRYRAEDIPLLARYFVRKHSERSGRRIEAVEDGAFAMLQDYPWPGNVRELENTIERAVVLSEGTTLTRDAVTFDPPTAMGQPAVPSLKLRQNLQWAERETIRRALEVSRAKGDAARLMGISPRALSYYLSKYPSIEQACAGCA